MEQNQNEQTATAEQRRKRGGRKALPDELRRCVRVQPSFTIDEFAEVERRAEAMGIDVSEWLRVAALGQTLHAVPAVNRVAYSELSRLASNLNQLAAKANAASIIDAGRVVETTEAVAAILRKLRLELIGQGRLQ